MTSQASRLRSSTLGVVLRTQPIRDADLIVTLFTSELGKVSALARGAKRSQRRFAGALGQLVLATFELSSAPRAELWTLEGATVERQWLDLATDVASVAHASYALELVRELFAPETPEPQALALVLALWDCLRQGASAAVLRRLELGLLELFGSPPALQQCAACGAAIADGAATLFDPSRGGVICDRCAPQSRGAGARPLGATARDYLVALARTPELAGARALEQAVDAADRQAARDAMLAMIRCHVSHPLRTLEFISKLNQAGS